MDAISRDEALEFLREAPVAHVGVISDQEPYVTPMSFVLIGERILFRTAAGRKLEAIQANPAVCVEASSFDPDTGDWISVIARGRAEEVTDEALATETVLQLIRKYQQAMGSLFGHGRLEPWSRVPHVIGVEIEEMSGLSSGRGLSPRTRPGRL